MKLFLFCIGGTGSRVLKALTFLLASGVEVNATEIVPIIIDPDTDNGDVSRTIEILKQYQKVRRDIEGAGFERQQFFRTPIQTLASMQAASSSAGQGTLTDSFRYEIDGGKAGTFREFINLNAMSPASKGFSELLFSQKNLDAALDVGFKGNPHMGSVVLNKFKTSKEFAAFAAMFNEGDRIFVVSSIFGGTGAAGFPLLVKNIREADATVTNHARLHDAPLGAISILPYFGVTDEAQSAISSGTFVSKTKAALSYYAKHLTEPTRSAINAMYYIGDDTPTPQKNVEGAREQQNDAHYVEMLAAASIIDFMAIPTHDLANRNGRAVEPLFRECGLYGGNEVDLDFKNLGGAMQQRIFKPLTQYAYTQKYFADSLDAAFRTKQTWVKTFQPTFLSASFFREKLTPFNHRFVEWLDEMSRAGRKFTPFDLRSGDKLHNFVRGFEQKKFGIIYKTSDWNYDKFNEHLAKAEKEIPQMNDEPRMLATFWQATDSLFHERIG